MAKSTPKPYVPVETKIAELEAIKTRINGELSTAPEDQKAGLQEQLNDADRKIRWYQGRQKSTKFQAKAAASQTTAVTEPAAPTSTEAPSGPQPVNVATQS